MNTIHKLGLFYLSITILTLPALAQNTKKQNTQKPKHDPGGCYMVTSSGKNVNLGSLCGIKQAQPTDTKSNVFKIPIKRRVHKTPVIAVKFNNNQPFDMILDTGASGILVTQAMAQSLNLKPQGKARVTIADGSIVLFDTARVAKVTVGGVTVENRIVVIAPKAEIGLLGHAFFDNYDIKILEKEVEFHKR